MDGTVISLDEIKNSIGTDDLTYFVAGGSDTSDPPSPSNLPGGETVNPAFEATKIYSADTSAGDPDLGINQSNDVLGIVYTVSDGIVGIQDALNDGSLRIGLHVRSIDGYEDEDESDSFINTSIPDPAAIFLLGSACLIGFSGARRKFKK